uniref:Uncharacterized protein n=1 Tax=Rhizophagus irregularis (strain DAOM 181602 / DAOM 197198 / MUCL 43194) TaxID=747089 RepID=U9U7N5_RHIID
MSKIFLQKISEQMLPVLLEGTQIIFFNNHLRFTKTKLIISGKIIFPGLHRVTPNQNII